MKNPLLIVQLDIKLPNYLIRSSKMGIVNQNVLIGSIKKFNKIKLIAAKTTQDIVIQENRGWERDKNLYIIQCAFFHNNRKCSYILVDSDDTIQGKAWRGILICASKVISKFLGLIIYIFLSRPGKHS